MEQNGLPLAEEGWRYGFAGYYDRNKNPSFAACSGPVFLDGKAVHLPRETSEILGLSKGERVAICLIPEKKETYATPL